MIKNIALLIEDLTSFVLDETLFCGHRPQDAPVYCIVVLETAGAALTPECPDVLDKNIQIISRGKSYFEARNAAKEVYLVLHGTAGWNLPFAESGDPNYLAMIVNAITDPQYIGQDEKGNYEFSVNFVFCIEESSCTEI